MADTQGRKTGTGKRMGIPRTTPNLDKAKATYYANKKAKKDAKKSAHKKKIQGHIDTAAGALGKNKSSMTEAEKKSIGVMIKHGATPKVIKAMRSKNK